MTPIRFATTVVEIHYGAGIIGFIIGLVVGSWKVIVIACAFWFLVATMMICISLEGDDPKWDEEIKPR